MATHFKNSVLSQPECVFKIGFQFHTHNVKENILSEKKIFRFFGVKNAFFTKNYKFLEFLKISISSLGYQPLHTKKPSLEELFIEISVRENVYPLGQPTCVVGCMRSDTC